MMLQGIDAHVESPDDPQMDSLCQELAALSNEIAISGDWPGRSLDVCRRYGVFRWFEPREFGGLNWPDNWIAEAYVKLAEACLTTAFVITQRQAACSRLLASSNSVLKTHWLPRLADGSAFTTVAISHLSTSRQHQGQPALVATDTAGGFRLNGYSAWVTGAGYADLLVVGGAYKSEQILLAVPPGAEGLTTEPPCDLVALSASKTAMIRFNDVHVPTQNLVVGPLAEVMKFGGSGTGGLQTSALAIGLAAAAIKYLERESAQRPSLISPTNALREEWRHAFEDLCRLAKGIDSCPGEALRARANRLTLRTTQAALTAAKGAGYLLHHPIGRWCREALFFLVWSCPHPVAQANLCELAGISNDDWSSQI